MSWVDDELAKAKEKFHQSYEIDPVTGCWNWTKGGCKAGYGRIVVLGKTLYAHRFSALMAGKRLREDDDVIDHLCRNRGCVDPDHLEITTHAVNIGRGIAGAAAGFHQRSKTHCPRGHPYEGDNLYIAHGRDGSEKRVCRECKRIHARNKTTKGTQGGNQSEAA